MYLHKDVANFKEVIELVAEETGRSAAIVEKDYYITQILRMLSEHFDNVVFKGGTSLSKGFQAINRFSEDIDITFDEHIGASRRKKLKNIVLKKIGEELELEITNFDKAQSDRDYNAYYFSYHSVAGLEDDRMPQVVKLETALGSYAFPTVKIEIGNYVGAYLEQHNRPDLAEQYKLKEFVMKLQSLERTFIDKVFALCDYYLEGKSKRYSRHLYDIYKLAPRIKFDAEFEHLIKEVRGHRANMKICPSALPEVDVSKVVKCFCEEKFYEKDYETITDYFADDLVDYDATIENLLRIIDLVTW